MIGKDYLSVPWQFIDTTIHQRRQFIKTQIYRKFIETTIYRERKFIDDDRLSKRQLYIKTKTHRNDNWSTAPINRRDSSSKQNNNVLFLVRDKKYIIYIRIHFVLPVTKELATLICKIAQRPTDVLFYVKYPILM